MVIRTYRSADRKPCLTVINSNTPTFFAPHELAEFEGWLDEVEYQQSSLTAQSHYCVLEEKTILACGGFHLDYEQVQATLAWGMVANSWHRKGLGKRLLSFRIQTIKSLCPRARIYLDTAQHSYSFFEKMGFAVTKITPDYYAPRLDRYDMTS